MSRRGALRAQLPRFVAHKRSLGLDYSKEEWLLRRLDRMLVRDGGDVSVLDEGLVRRFVLADKRHEKRWARVSLMRQLALFLVTAEPRTFVSPRGFLALPRVQAVRVQRAPEFVSPMGPQLERFLTKVHGLGFVYHKQARFLVQLDRLAARRRRSALLDESLARRLVLGAGARPLALDMDRVGLLRRLARFLATEEPRTFMPPPGFPGASSRREPVARYRGPLAAQLGRFLAHKRALGLRYSSVQYLLRALDRLMIVSGAGDVLTEEITRRFVTECAMGARLQRLTVVRQLARFLAVEEPRTFIPPALFLGIRRRHFVVRVLSRQEARRFLTACEALPDGPRNPRRGLVHGVALRMLLLTGLRRGELIALTGRDVDLAAGVVTVREGKFGKSRFVPITSDLVVRLRAYHAELVRQIPGRTVDDVFFPGPDGGTLGAGSCLGRSFRAVLSMCGIDRGGRGDGPRLHDLRHSFACLRLLTWYEQGADLRAKVPLLATYLGHVGLVTSQVYLHMTSDLAGEVVRRFAARFGDLITELAS